MNGFKLFIVIETTLSYIPNILLSLSPFKSIITKKQKKTLCLSYLILLMLNIVVWTGIYIFFIENVAESSWIAKIDYNVIGLLGIMMNIMVIKGHMKEHVFISGIVASCQYLSLSFSVYISKLFSENGLIERYLVGIIVYILVVMFSYVPIGKILKKTVDPFLHMDSEGYWKKVWFIPIIMYFSMFITTSITESLSNGYQLMSRVLVTFVTLFLCYIVASDRNMLMEKQVATELLSQSKMYYTELQAKVEETKHAKHDLKQIFISVKRMAENDDKEGILELCKEVELREQEKVEVPYSGNGAVDSIIYHYMLKAQETKIDFKYQGIIRSKSVSDIDLCVLLGNALDNAFYGCMTRQDKRNITVIAQTEEQIVSIVIHNTFDGKIETKNDILLSRKRENATGGIGLSSMQAVCERYGGTMETKWNGDKFMVLFLLPV